MLNSESQGGWGAGGAPNPPTNPFAQPATSQHLKNPFASLQSQPLAQANPFLQKQSNGTGPTPNPFLQKPLPANPFAQAPSGQNRSASPFGQPSNSGSNSAPKSSSFGKPSYAPNNNTSTSNALSQRPSSFTTKPGTTPTLGSENKRKIAEYVQPAWPKQTSQKVPEPAEARSNASKFQHNGKRKNEIDSQGKNKFSRKTPDSELASSRDRPSTRNDKRIASTNDRGTEIPRTRADPDEFAKKITDQLAKDNIKPPRWPQNPGSFTQRQAVERLREAHKAYREKARKSLMRAGLIDDPDKKRRLDEALVFKGICEDMCPEWEKITRIVEHDIKGPEKDTDENGDLVPMPDLMVKRLARSAAGQDAPLPMDVRSVRALRRTLRYLIDLISSDDLLPLKHSFLWDRTRAIRIDFSFQKYAMTPAETKDQIYCLETIARFHVTSLHLLSQDGLTPTDFSEQQEVEQLGKTLISLMEVYDDCEEHGIECENEHEFRGYFIVFNAFNPGLMEMIDTFDRRFGHSPNIKSAKCISECISNIRRIQGPLMPDANSQMAVDAITVFFDIVANPAVSYTLACFAEIHFNAVRKAILKVFQKSFSRPRFGPKDLTPAILKKHLHTDTEEEAVEFFKKHGFDFDDADKHLILNQSTRYIDARVPHSFSGDIVERKRSGHTFAEVVHTTVFDENVTQPAAGDEITWEDEDEESLFVSDTNNVSADNNESQFANEEQSESGSTESGVSASPRPLPPMLGNHAVTKPTTSVPDGEQSVHESEGRSRSTSFSSVTSISTEQQSTTQTPSQPSGGSGIKATSSPFTSPMQAPQKQYASSVFASSSGGFGAQSTSNPSSTMGTSFGGATKTGPFDDTSKSPASSAPKSANPFSDLFRASKPPAETDANRAAGQNSADNASGQSASFIIKKVRFGADVSGGQTTANNATPRDLFDLPNKNQTDTAAPANSPSADSPSVFPPKASDSLNKGVFQPSGTPTLGSTSKASNSSEPTTSTVQSITTTATTPSTLTQAQQSSVFGTQAPAVSSSQPSMMQQISGISSTSTANLLATASADNSPKATTTAGPTATSQQVTSTNTAFIKEAVQDDAMSNFARWFVSGDKGLLESHIQNPVFEQILEGVWNEFQTTLEEEAIRKEEEKELAKAQKFRGYSLKVKYFYIWHEGFRKRQRINRLREEKEKARRWNLPENVAKREREAKKSHEQIIKEVRDSMVERSHHIANEAALLRRSAGARLESMQNPEAVLSIQGSGISNSGMSAQNIEDALLATGIFRGVQDEKAAARYAAMEQVENEKDVIFEKKKRLRVENHRRTERGLRPLKALPEPRNYKEGSKTAMLRASHCGSGRDTMSMSTGSLRESTFSSSYRSSLGYNTGRVSKPRTRVRNPHWRLRANGLVQMPNGQYLHESVALPLLEGEKQIPGFGSYGLPTTDSAVLNGSSPSLPGSPLDQPNIFQSNPASSSPSGGGSQKRKRQADEEDVIPNGNKLHTRSKRARSVESDSQTVTDAGKHLADIASLLSQVESRVCSIRNATPKEQISP
ncbi:SAC3/GANP/Nin1/mts3/eIF-3 p25 family-domain-containing protein [Hypoxylon trugodes]|uniref:SAC3/GANP/Nin1/mts3/eIF-3 p25 family-domain-containing protein n=1 Tax=Hypoxylon trugodes TaxID=326681 RepID=UPI00219C6F6B|nr:SAC3/GANP/Nin1/mts3/eIF-3 p25 family-domain-containing protein [Hypoxylon trugodes]KAI1391414.1 SAC3/GANP/Nin1/mts3/eIF-3 p25 family-domain-containing protein [Hypoxylon trugodes]